MKCKDRLQKRDAWWKRHEKRCHGSDVMESVMEGCHGSVTEVMRHGSVVEKVSWKRLLWKGVMEGVMEASVMER